MAQTIGRYGTKVTKPGRVIHTGRVISANTHKRVERESRPLRERRKPRFAR